ncbi:MAG: hypothetical protein F6K30_13915 [Cyanothece sp. SIO2G6]|nr:hypothetical protein [Cyanothece sp. SIO2G6]
MMSQALTLQLPISTYQRLLELAQQSDRPLEEATLQLLNIALGTDAGQVFEIESQLSQLSLLTDGELWEAATTIASEEDNNAIQILLEKQQREGLTTDETEQVQALSRHFNQIMMVRAKAAATLAERGHDISSITPSP